MRRNCAACSAEFDAKRDTAKYCSARCRVRANSSKPKTDRPGPPRPVPADVDGELTAATLTELTAAGRVDSAFGRAALLLARRLDSPVIEPGSAVAAMVRQHAASLADALKGAAAEVDPVDELRSRRDRKRAAG